MLQRLAVPVEIKLNLNFRTEKILPVRPGKTDGAPRPGGKAKKVHC